MTSRTTLTEFHAKIAKFLDQVEADRAEIVVTRPDHEPYVVLPLKELEGLRETLHLLSSRVNAKRVFASLHELDAGEGTQRNLVEP
jgi:antitoxin YefM